MGSVTKIRQKIFLLLKAILPKKLRIFLRAFESQISISIYLIKINAPIKVLWLYYSSYFRNKSIKKKYSDEIKKYRERMEDLAISNDWFTNNIPFWIFIINRYGYKFKRIEALEIGSWEGLSSLFLLENLPKCQLTCADTWKGADEHKKDFIFNQVLKNAENNFDRNTKIFNERLIKYKGTSFSFYNNKSTSEVYDFIYIDGSHFCDDLLIDSIKCFQLLKTGGVMIFDDYLWRYYKKPSDNPGAAINSFLILKKGQYKIICMYYQIAIEKITTSVQQSD